MAYGDTAVIKTRTGGSPEAFGFEDETNPEQALDDFITELQERASDEVDRYCGMRFDETTQTTDHIPSTGRQHISTRNDPVREIHSLKEGGRPLEEDDDYRLEPVRGMPEENIGRLKRIDSGTRVRDRRWRPGVEIEVTYDWGYTEETRPKVVDQVVEDMVVTVLNAALRERRADGVESESMDGFSVQYGSETVAERLELTEAMRDKLDSLKRQGAA